MAGAQLIFPRSCAVKSADICRLQKFLFLKSVCPHSANLELLYLQPGYRVYTCRHYERKLGMLAAHPSRHAVRAGRLNLTNPIGQKSNSSHIGLRSLFFFGINADHADAPSFVRAAGTGTRPSPLKLLLSRTLPQLSRARRGSSATLRARVLREQIRLCRGLTIMRFSI